MADSKTHVISVDCLIEKSLQTLSLQAFPLAAGEGFEPSHTESESAVLPLHKPAWQMRLYSPASLLVKTLLRYPADTPGTAYFNNKTPGMLTNCPFRVFARCNT